jgi:hypothetical protein
LPERRPVKLTRPLRLDVHLEVDLAWAYRQVTLSTRGRSQRLRPRGPTRPATTPVQRLWSARSRDVISSWRERTTRRLSPSRAKGWIPARSPSLANLGDVALSEADYERALDAFQHPFAYDAFRGLLPEGAAGAHAVDQAVAELEQQTLSYL